MTKGNLIWVGNIFADERIAAHVGVVSKGGHRGCPDEVEQTHHDWNDDQNRSEAGRQHITSRSNYSSKEKNIKQTNTTKYEKALHH